MKWSKAQIRDARKLPLAPLLRDHGFILHEMPGENFRVERFGDLVVKDCYWIWKSSGLHGNTIDFFVLVQNLSFADAMRKIFPVIFHTGIVKVPCISSPLAP